jgi:hypothetical protein
MLLLLPQARGFPLAKLLSPFLANLAATEQAQEKIRGRHPKDLAELSDNSWS